MAAEQRVRDGSCHFQRSRVLWMAAIIFGMVVLGWVTLWPSTIPYSYLGIFGTFLNYLVENHHKWVCYGFWVSWLIHIVEALYSIKLCHTNHPSFLRMYSGVYLATSQRRRKEKLVRKQIQICSSAVVLSLAVGLYCWIWSVQVSLLCKNRSKGITDPSVQFQWFIQTFLFGYASFGLLVAYKPSAKKQY